MEASSRLRDVLERRYRVNPAVKLVRHDDLPAEQRAAFDELAADDQHFGILLSEEIPELGVQAVDYSTAEVIESLWQPATVRDLIPDPLKVAGLVLDGVLQIEQDGSFIAGPAAFAALFKRPFCGFSPADTISALSFTALQLSQMLPTADPREMSRWLYHYQTLPVCPTWARRLANRGLMDDFLGLRAGYPLRQKIDDHFATSEIPGWRSWQNLHSAPETGDHLPTYKLYISPRPEALPQLLARAVQVFVECGVPAFKLGSNAFGLLRPDKLIAYFNDFESLQITFAGLSERLGGIPAHGVPFTAALSGDGLLSWGLDPPREEQIPGWQNVLSWRLWVTNRLARAVIRARVLDCAEMEPWQFALLRLNLEGVDTRRWLPANMEWMAEREQDDKNRIQR